MSTRALIVPISLVSLLALADPEPQVPRVDKTEAEILDDFNELLDALNAPEWLHEAQKLHERRAGRFASRP